MRMDRVAQMGLDAHRTFSKVTGWDAEGRVVCRMRIDHGNQRLLQEDLRLWPKGTPVTLEGTFGWGWSSEGLPAAPGSRTLPDCRGDKRDSPSGQ